jgi:hypothetical protein
MLHPDAIVFEDTSDPENPNNFTQKIKEILSPIVDADSPQHMTKISSISHDWVSITSPKVKDNIKDIIAVAKRDGHVDVSHLSSFIYSNQQWQEKGLLHMMGADAENYVKGASNVLVYHPELIKKIERQKPRKKQNKNDTLKPIRVWEIEGVFEILQIAAYKLNVYIHLKQNRYHRLTNNDRMVACFYAFKMLVKMGKLNVLKKTVQNTVLWKKIPGTDFDVESTPCKMFQYVVRCLHSLSGKQDN